MSIIIDSDTRLVVSGLTGREGSFHGLRNRDYGTQVVAGVTHREVSKVGSPLPTRFLASRGRAERQCRKTRARDGVGKKSEKGVAFSARWREIFPRAGYYVFLLGRASGVFRHFCVREKVSQLA